MTQKYWEEYSLDSYNMLSHSSVNNINKRKLTSWFKNLLIMATKNTNLFWRISTKEKQLANQHHLRTQTQHKPLCYLGYLYLHNCGSHSEMQDIILFSKARQTWSLFWHHTRNLNYHPQPTWCLYHFLRVWKEICRRDFIKSFNENHSTSKIYYRWKMGHNQQAFHAST